MPLDDERQRALIVALVRQIHELRAGHEALLRTFCESFPDASVGNRLLDVYQKHKAEFYESVLLNLEEQFPRLAAEIDTRPPLPPTDDGGLK